MRGQATVGGGGAATLSGARLEKRLAELYDRHSRELVHVGVLVGGDHSLAQDLAHEAFVRLMGRFGDLRDEDAARAYLIRTVINLAKNHYRKSATEKRFVAAQPSAGPTAIVQSEDVEQRDALVARLRRLPHRQCAALVLRFCLDYSEKQAADALGVSVGAVKALTMRGLAALREDVEATDERSARRSRRKDIPAKRDDGAGPTIGRSLGRREKK